MSESSSSEPQIHDITVDSSKLDSTDLGSSGKSSSLNGSDFSRQNSMKFRNAHSNSGLMWKSRSDLFGVGATLNVAGNYIGKSMASIFSMPLDPSGSNRKNSIGLLKDPDFKPRQIVTGVKLGRDQLMVDALDSYNQYIPKQKYATNKIKTTKYTILTFIPKNLFEQFHKLANFFFLVLVILQLFPVFEIVHWTIAAAPLTFIVGLTALKDAFEDYKRWRMDVNVNKRPVQICEGLTNWNYYHSLEDKESVLADADSIKAKAGHHKNFFIRGVKTIFFTFWMILEKFSTEIKKLFTCKEANDDEQKPQYFWKTKRWKDIHVGDIVMLRNDDPLPCDLLLLSSSEPDCIAYVETKNLDGETNLKVRQGPVEISNKFRIPENFGKLKIMLDSEPPSMNMLRYHATLNIYEEQSRQNYLKVPDKIPSKLSTSGSLEDDANSIKFSSVTTTHKFSVPSTNSSRDVKHADQLKRVKQVPLDMSSLLMRGCVLRNTEWVIGMAVFTGEETRQLLNSGKVPSKRSKIDRIMNPHILICLLITCILCLVGAVGYQFWINGFFTSSQRRVPTFLRGLVGSSTVDSVINFFYGLLLYQNIVPISLYITVELVKTAQAYFIHSDIDMYYEENDTPCSARTWTLSDNLGQIEYIFSDKTGTLTRNIMEFSKCCIDGTIYDGSIETLKRSNSEEIASSPSLRRLSMSTGNLSFRSAWTENRPTILPPITPVNEQPEQSIDMSSIKRPTHKHNKSTSSTKSIVEALRNNGAWFDERIEEQLYDPRRRATTHATMIRDFFTLLSVCHTVLVEKSNTSEENDGKVVNKCELNYKAQSPDEACLVKTAAENGFIFKGREHHPDTDENQMIVEVMGKELKFTLLNILEFDSDRKRMSVLVRPPTPKGSKKELESDVIVFTKGADSIIFERLLEGQEKAIQNTEKCLEEFAQEGLRTLCLAYRKIPAKQYKEWQKRYFEASTQLYVDPAARTQAFEALNDEIERDLVLLGATAIEDKLQDGVPECITSLAAGGIKIWVLTGDKMETATNVGFLCGLLKTTETVEDIENRDLEDEEMILIQVKHGSSSEDVLSQFRRAIDRFFGGGSLSQSAISGLDAKKKIEHALIIDGQSLKYALENEEAKTLFLRLGCRCKAVICCRVSPLQKAKVVELIKKEKGAMTLAIGDGDNDVSMIKAADVGVGISGEEGVQAAVSADYAIAQFRFLKNLLLVHGRWSYSRVSSMILNFYLKSVVFSMVIFWFQFYSGFSAGVVYEFTYALYYNVIFTVIPVVSLGLFDGNLNKRTILAYPQIYGKEGITRSYYTNIKFSIYLLEAAWQSATAYFITMYSYGEQTMVGGYSIDVLYLGTIMAFSTITSANAAAAFDLHGINIISAILTAISSLAFPVYVFLLGYINNSGVFLLNRIYIDPMFWFVLIITFAISFVPRFLSLTYRHLFNPTDYDILLEIEQSKKKSKESLEEFADNIKHHQETRASREVLEEDRRMSMVRRIQMGTGEMEKVYGYDFNK